MEVNQRFTGEKKTTQKKVPTNHIEQTHIYTSNNMQVPKFTKM